MITLSQNIKLVIFLEPLIYRGVLLEQVTRESRKKHISSGGVGCGKPTARFDTFGRKSWNILPAYAAQRRVSNLPNL